MVKTTKVYIRTDFVNHVSELLDTQVEELVGFANSLQAKRIEIQNECASSEGHEFDGIDSGSCLKCGLTIEES